MVLGVAETFDDKSASGTVRAVDGCIRQFSYAGGQNMFTAEGVAIPQFTGRHEQPNGFQLKSPEIGDALVLEIGNDNSVTTWGYVRHFIELLERCHGTAFADSPIR